MIQFRRGSKLTLYSNIWATLLMLIMFFFSGSLGGSRSITPVSRGPSSSSLPQTRVLPNSLAGRTIIVDPGHGGPDPGTVGIDKTTESENVLAIAWELKGMLESAGATVIMTRQTDVDPAYGTTYQDQTNGQLAARTAKANRSNADIFVSIHNDWNDKPSVAGTATYYYKAQDLALAEAIQQELVGQLGSEDLGLQYGNLYVLRNTSMPSALIEVGFLSNPREADLLSQAWYRLEAARGIFTGIVNYFQSMR